MLPPRRLRLLLPALLLVALALPSAAFGQANRTWVSGVGDDVNPCSRTAPCKTFVGARNKTASGGEINVLDGCGCGSITIDRSLTLRVRGAGTGGIAAPLTNGIIVNAQPTDKVTIDNVNIHGYGTGAPSALSGIKVLSAARVTILNSTIQRFQAGVAVVPTVDTRVRLRNNDIYENGIGLFHAPGSNAISSSVVTARRNDISDNVCGVATGAFGANASTPNASVNCGLADFVAASPINEPVVTRLFRNGIEDNQFGVFGRGANSTSVIAHNEIVGNTSFGLRRTLSSIIKSTTPGSNVLDNANDEAANGTVTLG